jgi:hypothetical protein
MHMSEPRNCGLVSMHIELQLYWYHNPFYSGCNAKCGVIIQRVYVTKCVAAHLIKLITECNI